MEIIMYGKVIKALMIEHSFNSNYELSKESGVSAVGIANILNDSVSNPHRGTLKKLAAAFGLSVKELRDLCEDNKPGNT
jgi:transcriptional regulator with XRE-family HTH domain